MDKEDYNMYINNNKEQTYIMNNLNKGYDSGYSLGNSEKQLINLMRKEIKTYK